jgi:hypothetical protein
LPADSDRLPDDRRPSGVAVQCELSLDVRRAGSVRGLGLNVIDVGAVPDAIAGGREAVAISIKDGLADVADNARPLFAVHGIVADR